MLYNNVIKEIRLYIIVEITTKLHKCTHFGNVENKSQSPNNVLEIVASNPYDVRIISFDCIGDIYFRHD